MFVPIRDLYVECSLQMRNFDARGVCGSDCCGRSATSGVIGPNGITMWRCKAHEGVVDFRAWTKGDIVYSIERKEQS